MPCPWDPIFPVVVLSVLVMDPALDEPQWIIRCAKELTSVVGQFRPPQLVDVVQQQPENRSACLKPSPEHKYLVLECQDKILERRDCIIKHFLPPLEPSVRSRL